MIDCPNAEVRDQLPDYVHGTLDPISRVAVKNHVASCAECSAELELLQSLRVSMLADTPPVNVERITAALAQVPHTKRRPPRRFATTHAWRAAAAVVIMAGASAALIESHRGTPIHPDDSTRVVAQNAPIAEMSFGGGVSDIDASDLKTLIAEVKNLDDLTPADPASLAPVPPESDQ